MLEINKTRMEKMIEIMEELLCIIPDSQIIGYDMYLNPTILKSLGLLLEYWDDYQYKDDFFKKCFSYLEISEDFDLDVNIDFYGCLNRAIKIELKKLRGMKLI